MKTPRVVIPPTGLTGPSSSIPASPGAVVRDLALLHPVFRYSISEILKEMELRLLPIRLYETYRTPARQAYLYAQGRTRPGTVLTQSEPWDSLHQYGLAADFGILTGDTWTWDAIGPLLGCWEELHDTAEMFGLESNERSHLQMSGIEISDLHNEIYPSGGDQSWWDNLQANLAIGRQP